MANPSPSIRPAKTGSGVSASGVLQPASGATRTSGRSFSMGRILQKTFGLEMRSQVPPYSNAKPSGSTPGCRAERQGPFKCHYSTTNDKMPFQCRPVIDLKIFSIQIHRVTLYLSANMAQTGYVLVILEPFERPRAGERL